MQARKTGGYVVAAVLAWLALGIAACGAEDGPRTAAAQAAVVVHTTRGDVRVRVEVADTPAARARGLMHRTTLAADAGMLFVFPRADRFGFWMKDTPLALDMIFIGEDQRVVDVARDARPFTTIRHVPDAPARFVLEVHAGFSDAHGITTGDRVSFSGVPGL